MTKKNKSGLEELSIVDAVETLSSIAELDSDKETSVVEEHQLAIKDKKLPYRSVRWLHQKDGELTLAVIKDIFRAILDYLKAFYKSKYRKVEDEETAEGIRTIMVLVGEAAKNLDKFANLFAESHHSVSITDMEEFKQLQKFYLSKVAPRIDEGHLGKWVLTLSKEGINKKSLLRLRTKGKSLSSKHVYVDLDTVKRDTEYELFQLRKEDGTRFYNPHLIRNLKLVCDLSDYFHVSGQRDPLKRLDVWLDSYIQACASDMVASLRTRLDQFFHEAMRHKGNLLVEDLSKATMALLLSASPRHLQSSRHASKNCLSYFEDFQKFLREVLVSKDFQKIVLAPTGTGSKIAQLIRETALGLCRGLYLHAKGFKSVQSHILDLLKRAGKEQQVAQDQQESHTASLVWVYTALQQLLNKHAHGPLNKVLDLVLNGDVGEFDPIARFNIPWPMFALHFDSKRLLYTRIPNPTHQEYIHKAYVGEEFKGYLLSCQNGHGVKKHFCILLQDRTSWKESARCFAVESLLHHKEYTPYIDVCAYSIDTPFYHQMDHYLKEDKAETFKRHFLDHLKDEQTGYYFPVHLQHTLYKEFFSGIIEAVHKCFFEERDHLSREERHAFIDLVHLFTTFKMVELNEADALSYCCKDGLDTSVAMSALLFALFDWMGTSQRQKEGKEFLHSLLFAPALLWRERAIQSERFYRLANCLDVLEKAVSRSKKGDNFLRHYFSHLYTLPIWDAELSWSG